MYVNFSEKILQIMVYKIVPYTLSKECNRWNDKLKRYSWYWFIIPFGTKTMLPL